MKSSNYNLKLRLYSLVLVGVISVIGSQNILLANCEAKEFDWSDLGVSLAAPKSALTAGSAAANNLRILVSPQRRISKSYEYDYSSNSTQPIQSEANYVIPGSNGAYTASSQTGASSIASHASAYSALSASLASLKNRLSARGVTLTSGQLSGDPSAGSAAVSAYSAGSGNSNTYATSLLASSQPDQQQPAGGSQPTYLSVSTAGQDPSSSVAQPISYAAHNQSNDNKTIVLAIPAKINFLTDGSLTGKPANGAQEYGARPKQIAIQEAAGASLEQIIPAGPAQVEGAVMEQPGAQQYVIVNSTPTMGEPQVAGQQYIAPASQAAAYPSLYSKVQPIALKYIQHPAASYQPEIQLPQVQKLYATAAIQAEPSVEQAEQQASAAARYGSCLDTCNSGDPKWRKQSVSKYKYCCSRSAEYDPQFDHPSPMKLSESAKNADDAYYSYLYRKTRSRRSRRQQGGRSNRYRYYPSSGGSSNGASGSSSSSSADEDNQQSQHGDSSQSDSPAGRQGSSGGRVQGHYYDHYPYATRYYKGRVSTMYEGEQQHQPASAGNQEGGKYAKSERASGYRKTRGNREFASTEAHGASDYNGQHQSEAQQEDEQQVYPAQGAAAGQAGNNMPVSYGAGDYSVEGARYPSPSGGGQPMSSGGAHQGAQMDSRGPYAEEEETPIYAKSYPEESMGEMEHGKQMAPIENPPADSYRAHEQQQLGQQDEQTQTEHQEAGAMSGMSGNGYVRHRGQQQQQQQQQQQGYKERKPKVHRYSKKMKSHAARKAGKGRKQEQQHGHYGSSQTNGTSDYESAQAGTGNNSEQQTEHNNYENNNEEQRDNSEANNSEGDVGNKYKQALNESTVANLSKTTMHLKEILSILEKKTAYSKSNNETSNNQQGPTSTPSPMTTTNSYPLSSLFGSSYNSPALQSAGDFLISELSLKSPYRFDASSLGSPLSASSALSLGPSFGADSLGSLSSFGGPSNHFGMSTGKHPLSMSSSGPGGMPNGHPHQRKRRPNKNGMRYNPNGMMMSPKPSQVAHPQASTPMGMHVKSPFLNSAYYPYWYTRPNSPSVTNAYPYRNLHKNPYASLLSGPLTSKLAAAAAASAGLYSDEFRSHGGNPYEQLASVASSLRSSPAMRLRPKPYVFHSHVMPIYTRHSILAQPLDVKK